LLPEGSIGLFDLFDEFNRFLEIRHAANLADLRKLVQTAMRLELKNASFLVLTGSAW
jgi:hypothetical protein